VAAAVVAAAVVAAAVVAAAVVAAAVFNITFVTFKYNVFELLSTEDDMMMICMCI